MTTITDPRTASPVAPGCDTVAQLLEEGAVPLLQAARAAGLRPAPSLATLIRAALSGRLTAVKVAGRWMTSRAAIVRWVAAQQEHRRSAATGQQAQVDAPAVLSRYGLSRDQIDRGAPR